MKKFLTILLLVAVVFTTFVACSSSPSSGNKKCYVHIEGKTKKATQDYFLACDKDGTWYLYRAHQNDGNVYDAYSILKGTLDKATRTIKFGETTTFDMKTKTLTTGTGSFKCDGAALKSFTPGGGYRDIAETILTCKCYGAEYTLRKILS